VRPENANAALYYAAGSRNEEVVRLLLERAPSIKLVGYLDPPMDGSEAVCGGTELDEKAAFVLKKGANLALGVPPDDNFRAISWAACTGDEAMTKFLLSKGADVGFPPTIYDESLLRDAIKGGSKAVVGLLLDNGVTMAIQDTLGGTGLDVAARLCDLDIAKLLIERGVGLSSQTRYGETALYCAAGAAQDEVAKKEMVELLLRSGADPNIGAVSCDYSVPLHIAAANGCQSIVLSLIAHGAYIDAAMPDGRTALSFAVTAEDESMARLLIDNGASVGVVDSCGVTPLHVATETPEEPMVALLLDNGANVNAQDDDGWSPLHWAGRHENIIRMLLDRGADVTLKSNQGRTALDLVERGDAGVRTLLENAMRSANKL
jgi:ankyrin repeat protein